MRAHSSTGLDLQQPQTQSGLLEKAAGKILTYCASRLDSSCSLTAPQPPLVRPRKENVSRPSGLR
jgi:hypothetical protein